MNSFLSIKDTTENKITYYHLLIFLVMLTFDRLYSELTLIRLCIHPVILHNKEKLRKVQWRQLLLAASIYLLTCLGTIYTHYTDEAFCEWERQLAILLFPLVFSLTSFDLKKYTFPLLKGLAISCTLTIIYLYFDAFQAIRYNHLSLQTIFSNTFINHNFSLPIDLHATYFSMYIVLSVVTLFNWLMNATAIAKKCLLSIALLVLLMGLLQLSSRAALIALAIVALVFIPLLLLNKQRRLRFALLTSVVIACFTLIIARNDTFRDRYIAQLKDDLTQRIINNNVLEPRAVRWECAWELIHSAPVIGYGSGSEIPLLKEVYFKHRYYNSYINQLNAHNEYLSFLLKTGCIGLVVYLYLLYRGFRKAILLKNIYFCCFLCLVVVVSFSENILDVNKGIFFFAFFFSFFYFQETDKPAIE